MVRRAAILLGICMLAGCAEPPEYVEFHSTSNGSWAKEEAMEFRVEDPDTTRAHSVYIYVRNDHSYPYSNLFLITEMSFPDGASRRDTLEYEMADAQGNWLGSGMGSVKESKLGYKQDVVFPTGGVYTFTITHAMRQNGQVDGVESLPGVLDVGLQIE